jgi:hypothetical protein
MRKTCTLVMLLLSLSVGQDVLRACGDKFFLVGRGDRFSRAYFSLHPGSVLVYTGGASQISKGLANPRLHKLITRAGHRVLVASNRAELARQVTTHPVDVILLDLLEAPAVMADVSPVASNPELLPIADEGGAARALAKAPVQARLSSSDKANRFLAEIEKVMETRARARRKA